LGGISPGTRKCSDHRDVYCEIWDIDAMQ
jgi:hypothetical protein